MKHKKLRILSLLLLILIAAESSLIFHKVLKKEEGENTIPTIQAEGSQHQTNAKGNAEREATPEEAYPEKETKKQIPQSSQTEKITEKTEENQMTQLIEEKIAEYDGIWSVYLKTKGMKTEEVCDVYSKEQGRSMKSASLIKLFVMETLYDGVEKGTVDRETMEGLVQPMITVSDNTACNTLVTDVLGNGNADEGMAAVTWYAQQNGYRDTAMGRLMLSYQTQGDNYTSAKDCVALLEKIYDGTCVNTADSSQMLSFLQNQERKNKIPYGLQTRLTGEQEWTANKTGEIAEAEVPEKGMVEGDAAIVHTEFGDYILCILVNDMSSNAQTQAEIQELSGWIYDYLAAKNR
ncbi:MAG: serine hydrolase [Eubacteriales bacterium]|nr:serine hydrolase [Eubacteriales bacterium]